MRNWWDKPWDDGGPRDFAEGEAFPVNVPSDKAGRLRCEEHGGLAGVVAADYCGKWVACCPVCGRWARLDRGDGVRYVWFVPKRAVAV